VNLNKLKYLRNEDVMGGAKCTARTARPRTPLPYTTEHTHTEWVEVQFDLLTHQLYKNSNDSREKLRLNFHSLSVSVSELSEYRRKCSLRLSSTYQRLSFQDHGQISLHKNILVWFSFSTISLPWFCMSCMNFIKSITPNIPHIYAWWFK
jgi:hypothetical protein